MSATALGLSPVTSRPDAAPIDVEGELEVHRKELTGYCYRMLGSGFEAEDAVQETLVRAWKNADRFEGRSSVRSWLYRIATNVCLDMLRGPQRRARPMDFGGPIHAGDDLGPLVPETEWVQPMADDRILPSGSDPAEMTAARESVRLAFVAALHHLPPKQRAVLILREVLKWQAAEVAELLDTSVQSVNSALQRARATLADIDMDGAHPLQLDDSQRELVAKYAVAFERYDIASLVTLLHDDAKFTMPPFGVWFQGTDDIAEFYVGQGAACEGSRLVPIAVNGCFGFGSYKPVADGWEPWAIQVIEVSDGRISGLHHFLYPELFAAFGLPARLER